MKFASGDVSDAGLMLTSAIDKEATQTENTIYNSNDDAQHDHNNHSNLSNQVNDVLNISADSKDVIQSKDLSVSDADKGMNSVVSQISRTQEMIDMDILSILVCNG